MSVTFVDVGVPARVPAATWLSDIGLTRVRRLGGAQICADLIRIPRPHAGGFDIELWCCDHRVTGDFGGLVQDFGDVDEALTWAERCRFETHRLRIDYAGNRPYRWALEKVLPNGGYVEILAAGHNLLLGRLLPKSVRYFENCTTARGGRAATVLAVVAAN